MPQPRYHNSLHTADVLVTLTLLMRMQLSHPKQSDWQWIACLLASAIGHDFDHPGRLIVFILNLRPALPWPWSQK